MIFSKKVLTISFILILVGFVTYFFFSPKGKEESAEKSSSSSTSEKEIKPQERPLEVKVTPAKRGELVLKLSSPGVAVTRRKVLIKAEVSGQIESLNVEEGQHVKKGDLLVELEDRGYKLNLQSAEASYLKSLSELLLEKQFAETLKSSSTSEKTQVKKLEKELQKARRLYDKGYLSREEFEELSKKYELALIESGEKKDELRAAVRGVTQSEVSVQKAQMELDKTKIKAPFSGIVCDIKVSPYEHVTNGQELFTLVNISKIHIEAKVLESEIGKIEEGQETDIRFSAYPGKVFKGQVKAVSPMVSVEDKTCKAIIEMENPEEKIKPGMHAQVEIAAETHKDRLLVPQEAVLSRGGRKLVFVVEEGLAKWRYVKVGLENEKYAEILDGVKEGEPVIVEGHFTLAHDAKVRVVQ